MHLHEAWEYSVGISIWEPVTLQALVPVQVKETTRTMTIYSTVLHTLLLLITLVHVLLIRNSMMIISFTSLASSPDHSHVFNALWGMAWGRGYHIITVLLLSQEQCSSIDIKSHLRLLSLNCCPVYIIILCMNTIILIKILNLSRGLLLCLP